MLPGHAGNAPACAFRGKADSTSAGGTGCALSRREPLMDGAHATDEHLRQIVAGAHAQLKASTPALSQRFPRNAGMLLTQPPTATQAAAETGTHETPQLSQRHRGPACQSLRERHGFGTRTDMAAVKANVYLTSLSAWKMAQRCQYNLASAESPTVTFRRPSFAPTREISGLEMAFRSGRAGESSVLFGSASRYPQAADQRPVGVE